MASKTKTGLMESTPTKTTPASPRVSKLVRSSTKSDTTTNSSSPLQPSRLSMDRSPYSANSKPSSDRRLPKTTVPSEKPQTRVIKGTDLQGQLTLALEDLKKVNDEVALLEREKSELAEELKHAQKVAEETNGKLEEALLAQRKAQEDSEIEIFRAVELEQAGIEAARSKEEEWRREIEVIKTQHAVDLSSLLSTTEELHKVKQDLAMVTDAKNKALDHADTATRIAEIHADKSEQLSSELAKHKALLEERLKNDAVATDEMKVKLQEEIESFKEELARAKDLEKAFENLSIELEASKISELFALKKAKEIEAKFDELEEDIEKAKESHLRAAESLESSLKQLEEKNDLLCKGDVEIASLRERVAALEVQLEQKKKNLEDSEKLISSTKEENATIVKEMEFLKKEMETLKEEKDEALEKVKLSADNAQILAGDKEKLSEELESSKNEEEKSKKALETLALALQEASMEARVSKEKLSSTEAELESAHKQIEELKLSLKTTNDNYEVAKKEAGELKKSEEESKTEIEKLTQQALTKADALKKSEETNDSLNKEVERLVQLVKESEEEACAKTEAQELLQKTLNEAKCEVLSSKEDLEEMKAENAKLKETLLEKETEMRNMVQEKEEIVAREGLAMKKVEEMSKMLEEVKEEENGEVVSSEKEYTLLEKGGDLEGTKGESEGLHKEENVEVEVKMWESCQVEKEDEEDECMEDGNGKVDDERDHFNGFSSLDNADELQSGLKKKKSPLFKRIGSMLKKGSTNAK